jgi:hypothetical protein
MHPRSVRLYVHFCPIIMHTFRTNLYVTGMYLCMHVCIVPQTLTVREIHKGLMFSLFIINTGKLTYSGENENVVCAPISDNPLCSYVAMGYICLAHFIWTIKLSLLG